MTDTIIKGSGNSRFLRSVPNLATYAPTYDKLLELLTGDGLPVDLLGPNPAGCDVVGTDLTKENLLKDTTAALFGLGTDAVPDDVLHKLSNNLKFAMGEYVGTGKGGTQAEPVELHVGFRPVMVEFFMKNQYYLGINNNNFLRESTYWSRFIDYDSSIWNSAAVYDTSINGNIRYKFTEDGFARYAENINPNTYAWLVMNGTNQKYLYLAIGYLK